ncbi:MAG TPA: hypothetical protein ENJ20_01075 [Bacteroidetes bacterium]|nr:hypothetical protein [Bacteroidota bacterium]
MSRNLLAAIVLFALIGLTFVQFRLLVIGARLEKQRFDQKILVAQRNIRRVLNEPNPVSDALIAFFQSKTKTLPHPAHLADSLHIFLKKEMEKVDIGAQFSFTIAPRFNADKIEFSSNNYNAEKKYNYKYAIPLGDYFSNQLHRDKTLHIYVENLFGYLLAELNYLIIPSVLCMIALLVCLVLLINILQKEQKLNIPRSSTTMRNY